jgi:hypothetical protein
VSGLSNSWVRGEVRGVGDGLSRGRRFGDGNALK